MAKNPLDTYSASRHEIGREGLQALCDQYNAERERHGVRERYRVDTDGQVWRLETFHPYRAPSTESALRLVENAGAHLKA